MISSWLPLPAPTAAVVDRHDDDADRPPHLTRPDLFTWNESTSFSQVPSLQTDDYVDRTLEKINKMISSWHPLPRERLHQPQWPTTMTTATPITETLETVLSQTLPNSTIPAVTRNIPEFPTESSINRRDDNDRPQPLNGQPSLSLQETFDLQLKVLVKINTVCDALTNLLDRYTTALLRPQTNPCRTSPARTTPVTISTLPRLSCLMEPTPTFVPLKPRIALISKITPYVNHIPAKPPYSRDRRHPAPIRTKDRMRPP